jgi:hypothetical protein
MGFVGAEGFFAQLAIFRLVWIRGRLGGGKTLLGAAIADELVSREVGLGVVSNIKHKLYPHPWRELLDVMNEPVPVEEIERVKHVKYFPIEGMPACYYVSEQMRIDKGWHYRFMRGAIILYDEAWQKLDNRTSMNNDRSYGAFARKFDSYWIFPSVLGLDKRVSYLAVERVNRFSVPVFGTIFQGLGKIPGLRKLLVGPGHWLQDEMWKYRYVLSLGYTEDTGTFWLMNPTEYFLKYGSFYTPISDGGIADLWARTVMDEKESDVSEGSWYIDAELLDPDEREILAGAYQNVRAVASRLDSVDWDEGASE